MTEESTISKPIIRMIKSLVSDVSDTAEGISKAGDKIKNALKRLAPIAAVAANMAMITNKHLLIKLVSFCRCKLSINFNIRTAIPTTNDTATTGKIMFICEMIRSGRTGLRLST